MENFDSNAENILFYFNIYNLYVYAMMYDLRHFSWLNVEEIQKFDFFSKKEYSSLGYILEVAIEYHDA